MDDILIKLKVTADNAAFITDDLAIIMQSIREGKGTIGELLMDSTLAQNVVGVIVTLKKVQEVSKTIWTLPAKIYF